MPPRLPLVAAIPAVDFKASRSWYLRGQGVEERARQTENGNQKIALTGATGRVGSHLVEILEQRGHDVVAIARSKGIDVVTGEGLDRALAGVDTIIDTATGPEPDEKAATEFFTASAR